MIKFCLFLYMVGNIRNLLILKLSLYKRRKLVARTILFFESSVCVFKKYLHGTLNPQLFSFSFYRTSPSFDIIKCEKSLLKIHIGRYFDWARCFMKIWQLKKKKGVFLASFLFYCLFSFNTLVSQFWILTVRWAWFWPKGNPCPLT